MRLGSYECELSKDSLAHELYGAKIVSERHRHRYEVNPEYVEIYAKKGLRVSGVGTAANGQPGLIEIMELDRSHHPYFIGTQAHPEFKSRLMAAAPLFKGLISAAVADRKLSETKMHTA